MCWRTLGDRSSLITHNQGILQGTDAYSMTGLPLLWFRVVRWHGLRGRQSVLRRRKQRLAGSEVGAWLQPMAMEWDYCRFDMITPIRSACLLARQMATWCPTDAHPLRLHLLDCRLAETGRDFLVRGRMTVEGTDPDRGRKGKWAWASQISNNDCQLRYGVDLD